MKYTEVETLELLMLALSHFEREAAFHEHLAQIRNQAEHEEAYHSFKEVFQQLKELAERDRWRENPDSLKQVLESADKFKVLWNRNGGVR